MYELIKINDSDYYIESPSRVGVVKVSENEVILIDTGNNRAAGKKIKKALDSEGWTVRAIYITHSHGDHIGGARYLYEAYGCKVYARGIERGFTADPILESAFLYGANPPAELRTKFLLAEDVPTEYLTEDILEGGLSVIGLPGHCFDMVGFRTKSGTVYLADALSNKEILDKYKIGYIYDVGAYLKTLESVKEMEGELFVPSHVAATENIAELADYNIKKVLEVADKICEICDTPRSFDEILKKIFEDYELTMTFEQHALVGSAVRSYLTYLRECARLEAKIENNMLTWKKI